MSGTTSSLSRPHSSCLQRQLPQTGAGEHTEVEKGGFRELRVGGEVVEGQTTLSQFADFAPVANRLSNMQTRGQRGQRVCVAPSYWGVPEGLNNNPQVGRSSAHNISINSLAHTITISISNITTSTIITIITMSVFTAINIPRLSNLSSAAAGNGGDPPPPSKPVGLRAQCNKEGSGSESTGEFVVVATTTKKRKGNG
ncbi:MAG: hypothetical protein FRX49_13752, partial [Trebouxia sp. A1-2]